MSLLRNDFPHSGAVALIFDQPGSLLTDLREAVALLTGITANRLKAEKLLAQKVVVWMETMCGSERHPHVASQRIDLPVPIASAGVLAAFTQHAVDELYRPGSRYRQAGVYCEDLSPDQSELLRRFHYRVERAERPYGIVSRTTSHAERHPVPAWA